MELTKETLVHDLKELGLSSGDTVFVRISYKSIGKVQGGPETVIDAILDVIGVEGTIIASAFPRRQQFHYSLNKVVFEPGKNLSTGIIPIFLSQKDNALFSSNPISPFVCVGKYAKQLTDFHTPEKENIALLQYAMTLTNPKCLCIGGNTLTGTTHLAFTAGLKNTGHYQLRRPDGIFYKDSIGKLVWKPQTLSAFCYEGYASFFHDYIQPDSKALLRMGKVGHGDAKLIDMRTTHAIEMQWISSNPQILSCSNPNCLNCRTSYSYSDTSKLKYVFYLLCQKIKRKYQRRSFLSDAYTLLLLSLLGRKCQ